MNTTPKITIDSDHTVTGFGYCDIYSTSIPETFKINSSDGYYIAKEIQELKEENQKLKAIIKKHFPEEFI